MAYALADKAQDLAAKGRNGDTMLVHMNPLEVQWMSDQTPGGLTINPDTGQPEAFAFLLPLLAGAVGPSLMGAAGLSGLGALAGTAALTGLTDYAVNKDPQKALGSGLLSFGLGGLGNAMKGGAQAVKATPGVASTVSTGADGIKIAGGTIPTAAAPSLSALGQQATNSSGVLGRMGTIGTVMQNPSAALQAIKSNPVSIGLPIALGGAAALSGMSPSGYKMPAKEDKYSGDYGRERFPGKRTLNQYDGDYSTYGVNTPEFNFFTPNNDRRAAPPSIGLAGLGAYGMAMGGDVPSAGMPVYGDGDGMSDSVPAIGPGQRPINLADGEYVFPADVVSMLGRGSTNGGVRMLDKMIAEIRANPPRQEKGAPPKRRAA
jgi:hypothetical protein